MNARTNAAQAAWLSSQLRYIEAEVLETKYPQVTYQNVIPVRTDVPEGFRFFQYAMSDMVGQAKFGGEDVDDAPLVDTLLDEFNTRIEPIIDGYQYTDREVAAASAAAAGLGPVIQLPAERAKNARKAIEFKLDDVAFFGDTARGLKGFANHPNVPILNLPNGAWTTSTTADDLEEDLRAGEKSISDVSLDTEAATAMAIPPSVWYLLTKRLGSFSTDTALDAFLANARVLRDRGQVYVSQKLETAGSTGGPRVVMFDRNVDSVFYLLPVPFRQNQEMRRAYGWKVPCWALTAGVIWKRPKSAVYLDVTVAHV